MNLSVTSHVDVQLVMADGATTNVKSAEYFSGRGMISLRGHVYEPGSIVEIVIGGQRRTVKAIENKEQVCQIRFELE